MRLHRLAVAATAVLLLVGVSACSSSGPDGTASKGTSTTASSGGSDSDGGSDSPGGTVKAVEVCPMVDAAAVTALGLSGAGQASDYDGPPGTAVGVCSFGSVVDETGTLVVQVETKSEGAVVDPLLIVLKNATRTEPVAASKPAGAKVYDVAVIPGGGGVGTSVAWEGGGHVVVAARTGDNVDVAQLETIVAGVVAKL